MILINRIKQWNKDRGLTDFNIELTSRLLREEILEVETATNNEDIALELGDILFVTIGEIQKLGYDPLKVLEEVIKKNESRVGAINPETKKWEKVKTGTEYTPKLD
jgi:NTP pyrophosphatase (non-canonical NTP hydrolase)